MSAGSVGEPSTCRIVESVEFHSSRHAAPAVGEMDPTRCVGCDDHEMVPQSGHDARLALPSTEMMKVADSWPVPPPS